VYGSEAGEAAGLAAGTDSTPGNGPKAASTSSWWNNPTTRSVATGVGTQYLGSLLAPKPEAPKEEPVTPMPDPEDQAAARRRRAAQRRQGRSASILTSAG
jgi:hypothetical protein